MDPFSDTVCVYKTSKLFEIDEILDSMTFEADMMNMDHDARIQSIVEFFRHCEGVKLYFFVGDKKIKLYPRTSLKPEDSSADREQFKTDIMTDINEVSLSPAFTHEMKEIVLIFGIFNYIPELVRQMIQQGVKLTPRHLQYAEYISPASTYIGELIDLFLEFIDEPKFSNTVTNFLMGVGRVKELKHCINTEKLVLSPFDIHWDFHTEMYRVYSWDECYKKIMRTVIDYYVETYPDISEQIFDANFFSDVPHCKLKFVFKYLLEKNIDLEFRMDNLWNRAVLHSESLTKFLYPTYVSGEDRLTNGLILCVKNRFNISLETYNWFFSRGACASNINDFYYVVEKYKSSESYSDICAMNSTKILFDMYEAHITGANDLGSDPEHIYQTVRDAYTGAEINLFEYVYKIQQKIVIGDLRLLDTRDLPVYIRFLDNRFSISDKKVDPRMLDFIQTVCLDKDSISTLMYILMHLLSHKFVYPSTDCNEEFLPMYDTIEELIKLGADEQVFLKLAVDNLNLRVVKLFMKYRDVDPRKLLEMLIYSRTVHFVPYSDDVTKGYGFHLKNMIEFCFGMQTEPIFRTVSLTRLGLCEGLIKIILRYDYKQRECTLDYIIPAKMRQEIIDMRYTDIYSILQAMGVDTKIFDEEIWAHWQTDQSLSWLEKVNKSNRTRGEIVNLINKCFVEVDKLDPDRSYQRVGISDWLDELLHSEDIDTKTMLEIAHRCCSGKYLLVWFPKNRSSQYRCSPCFARICCIVNRHAKRVIGADWETYLPYKLNIPREIVD